MIIIALIDKDIKVVKNMDLRILRTKKCIEDAFLKIREVKDIEKITVKEIAQAAMINKATFYNHYESVYDLSDKMEDEAIEAVIADIPPEDWGSGEGTKKLTVMMSRQGGRFNVLFSGSRYGCFASKLDRKIKERIFEIHPEYKDDPEKDIILTTIIYGGFYATSKYKGEDFERVTDVLAKISEHMIKGMLEKS